MLALRRFNPWSAKSNPTKDLILSPSTLFGSAWLHPLIGFPSLFAAFLVDVLGGVSSMPVGLPPGRNPHVGRVRVITTTSLVQVRLLVEHINGSVVSSVLLGGIVANGLAVVWIVTRGDFQRVDQGYVGDVRVLLLS